MLKKSLKFISLLLSLILVSCVSYEYVNIKNQALLKYPINKPFKESEFININGAKLHIRRWKPLNENKRSKGVVLLIHGVSGSTYNWRFLGPYLAQNGWDVLTADLPPFGFSGEKQENSYSMDPLPQDSRSRANLIFELYHKIYPEIPEKLILIGHSLGGRIASLLAIDNPDKVTQLVLLAPAVYGKSAIPTVTKYWPFNIIVHTGANIGLNNVNIVSFVAKMAYGGEISQEDLIGNIAPFLRDGVPEACGEWTIKSLDNEAPEMEKISIPTLILWSKNDLIVPNKGIKLQKSVKDSIYVEIPGSSHCIMDTDFKLIESQISVFLN